MTTQHGPTIQDASRDLWRLAGSDLFVLADRSGKVVALHSKTPGYGRHDAEQSLRSDLDHLEQSAHWWFGADQLYEVFVTPIYFGTASENNVLGFVAVGYEIDEHVLQEISGIASGHVAIRYGGAIVTSTLAPERETELSRLAHSLAPGTSPDEIKLGTERFLVNSIELAPGRSPVSLIALKSYDQATRFIDELNRLLLGLGMVAVLGGSVLVFLISHTFTRPLAELVLGVRAMGKGDASYPLRARGHDEVAEVTAAFDEMRRTLQKDRQDLLDAERLATIGRMASSISHDLRHSLTAIVANAEFLSETQLTDGQREDFYREVRIAANRMTDLIDSLLEFSWTRKALRRTFADANDSVDNAVQAIRAHPEFHQVPISVSSQGHTAGWLDAKKLERVLYNLLLNACEVVSKNSGRVAVELVENTMRLEIRIADNGPGIPDAIRERLFEAFVTHGKESGSGLGLAVAQKIVQDHGGEIVVEKTSATGTTFKVTIPLHSEDVSLPAARGTGKPVGADAKPAA
jgi:signal transduction histidine kinase